jgi:TolA-binding protein
MGMAYVDNQRRAELLLQQVLTKYPTSNRIGEVAYLLGDLYESSAFKQYRRAAAYYERCFQWSPSAPFDSRIRAARLYDKKVQDRTRASEIYQEISTHETDPKIKAEADTRVRELKGGR